MVSTICAVGETKDNTTVDTSLSTHAPATRNTLYELGVSYSAIGTHQSAISAMVEIPGVPQPGEHWLVSRFKKGIVHLRPPQPRYTKARNVGKVLSYLQSLGPNDSLNLKQLTMKTAALLTILEGRQIHTLPTLSVIHSFISLG